MDKEGIVKEVSRRTGYRQSDVTEVVNALTASIYESLVRGEDVWFEPIGKFLVRFRKPQWRYIPVDNEHRMSIPKYYIKFAASCSMTDALKRRYDAEQEALQASPASVENDKVVK